MGWVRRFLHWWQRPQTGPAWVNPQFLGIAIFLFCVGTVSVTLAMLSHTPGLAPPSQPAAEREYVGFTLADCLEGCDPAAALASWERAHPDAQIMSKEPVREAGILLGYWVTYEPEDPK